VFYLGMWVARIPSKRSCLRQLPWSHPSACLPYDKWRLIYLLNPAVCCRAAQLRTDVFQHRLLLQNIMVLQFCDVTSCSGRLSSGVRGRVLEYTGLTVVQIRQFWLLGNGFKSNNILFTAV
jgi:hypothetical protein